MVLNCNSNCSLQPPGCIQQTPQSWPIAMLEVADAPSFYFILFLEKHEWRSWLCLEVSGVLVSLEVCPVWFWLGLQEFSFLSPFPRPTFQHSQKSSALSPGVKADRNEHRQEAAWHTHCHAWLSRSHQQQLNTESSGSFWTGSSLVALLWLDVLHCFSVVCLWHSSCSFLMCVWACGHACTCTLYCPNAHMFSRQICLKIRQYCKPHFQNK